VQLSRAQFEPGEVEFLKAAWAGKAGDERKIDRESARGAILEKLDVPGLTESEVDKIIAGVVKDRESVDQEEFLRVRLVYLDPKKFGLLGRSADIGTIGVRHAQRLGCCSPTVEKVPQAGEESHSGRGEWWGCIVLQYHYQKNTPYSLSYHFALHAWGLPTPPVLGRMQQLDPIPTFRPAPLFSKNSRSLTPMFPFPRNIHRPGLNGTTVHPARGDGTTH